MTTLRARPLLAILLVLLIVLLLTGAAYAFGLLTDTSRHRFRADQ